MTDDETRARSWRWFRVLGALPGEAAYLARAHPDVDPGRQADVVAAADLLRQHRQDNRPSIADRARARGIEPHDPWEETIQ